MSDSANSEERCYCSLHCGGPNGSGRIKGRSTIARHTAEERKAQMQPSTSFAAFMQQNPTQDPAGHMHTGPSTSTNPIQTRKRRRIQIDTPTRSGQERTVSSPAPLEPEVDFGEMQYNGGPDSDLAGSQQDMQDEETTGNPRPEQHSDDEDIPDEGSLRDQADWGPQHSQTPAARSQSAQPSEDEDPFSDTPNFVPILDDIKIAFKYINLLKHADLRSSIEPLDDSIISQIHNPPEGTLSIDDPDHRMSLDIFLALSNASEASYDMVRTAILRRHPDSGILTYHNARKLVERLSGVSPIIRDMCINSCIGYTGAYAGLSTCPECGEHRYDRKKKGKVARKQFTTLPVSTQLQALWRTKEGAESLDYRRRCQEKILAELAAQQNVDVQAYRDYFDGSDFIEAVRSNKIKLDDMLLLLSVDGAQLYQNKASDCWMYIWVVLDHDPASRYKVRYVLPGGFIPGPNKPKNLDSFLFTGLYHLSAIQNGGMKVWDAAKEQVVEKNLVLALASADGPGMACLNGFVGHHGRIHCRFYCPLIGRHKPGAGHYYPARLKPHNYAETGCDHPDVDIDEVLYNFTSKDSISRYNKNLKYLSESPNDSQYKKRRLETGIVKPSIFSGLPRSLGVPTIFTGDVMHLPALNIPDLYINLWRGNFDCDKNDDKASWDWAVLKPTNVWKDHGKQVADLTPHIPTSFDRPPRNPAEKISSGYKAWEFLLYFYGAGPCLFYGLLPEKYWTQYCKLVNGILIMLQEEITQDELLDAETALSEASTEFEELYVQRRTDRLHFVRASVHAPSHLPHETIRLGPGIIYSQWTMEHMIGNLVEEIRQHSNSFSNLMERGVQRAQKNALKAMIPDLEPEKASLPRGAMDIGNGYSLRRAMDSTYKPVTTLEAAALEKYLLENGETPKRPYQPSIQRWARVGLPNGQIARSRWKEELKPIEKLRTARNVELKLHGQSCLAEVHFYFTTKVQGITKYLAMGSLYGSPHAGLKEQSFGRYLTFQHNRDVDVRVFEIQSISSVVMVAPDPRYGLVHKDGTEDNRYFLMRKPGLKMSWMSGIQEHDRRREERDEIIHISAV